jgi:ABC-type enterochelin transport system permease subunit
MDQKIAQYLNKDTCNILDKCFEILYISLNKDIELMCELFNKERSLTEISDDVSKNINNKFTIIKKRIEITIKTISDLNTLDNGSISYLGGG